MSFMPAARRKDPAAGGQVVARAVVSSSSFGATPHNAKEADAARAISNCLFQMAIDTRSAFQADRRLTGSARVGIRKLGYSCGAAKGGREWA